MRDPYPKVEDDSWTLDQRSVSDPEMRRASIPIAQLQVRKGSNRRGLLMSEDSQKERGKEQRVTMRVRIPVQGMEYSYRFSKMVEIISNIHIHVVFTTNITNICRNITHY